jgi:hypothetical protein
MLKQVAGAIIVMLVCAGTAKSADLALKTHRGVDLSRVHQAPKSVAQKRPVTKPKAAGERRPAARAPKAPGSAELSR